ncbi:MAG TPA: hypothetical protein VNI54_14285 [Thermoanaerobaculia bacterium]|nr:hypothetical protein [Thermoanaerobaculia bacterium]
MNRVWGLAAAIALAVAALARDPVLPDPASGNVGVVAGVLYWPSTLSMREDEDPKSFR